MIIFDFTIECSFDSEQLHLVFFLYMRENVVVINRQMCFTEADLGNVSFVIVLELVIVKKNTFDRVGVVSYSVVFGEKSSLNDY